MAGGDGSQQPGCRYVPVMWRKEAGGRAGGVTGSAGVQTPLLSRCSGEPLQATAPLGTGDREHRRGLLRD